MEKKRLKQPARGTVFCFDLFFIKRCNINEKIKPNTNNTKNEILEKVKANAKNNKASPSPKVFDREVFSFNLAYKDKIPIKKQTKTRFIIMIV